MHRLFALPIIWVLFSVQELAGQACIGSVAAPCQVGLEGLWARSGAADSYGLIAQANLPGRVSAGAAYVYSGDVPSLRDRRVHALHGRLAYEMSARQFSVCPALGASYEDGTMTLGYIDPTTQREESLQSGWRTIAVPATLNVGLQIAAAGDVVVSPTASAGGMLWHFDGQDKAAAMINGQPRSGGSQFAWVGSLGLTLGWNRIFFKGSATETSLHRFDREWTFSVGWILRQA